MNYKQFLFIVLSFISFSTLTYAEGGGGFGFCNITCPDGSYCEAQGNTYTCSCVNHSTCPVNFNGPAVCQSAFKIQSEEYFLQNHVNPAPAPEEKPIQEVK